MKLTPAEDWANRARYENFFTLIRQIQANAIRWAALSDEPGKYSEHKANLITKANQLDSLPSGNQACGDCDPCISGRPDQCAISPERK